MSNFSIIDNEDLNFIKKALQTILESKGTKKSEDPILDNSDVIQLLKISNRTLQTWRDQKIIHFSKINGKILYKLSDIMDLINRNTSK